MQHINVLFTAVSGWPTHATVGALCQSRNAEYTIVGVDCNPNVGSLNYVDYLYKVPRCDDEHYIDKLIEICKKHDIDIVVPLISEDIKPLWDNRELFEKDGIKILLSGKDSKLMIANDKLLLEQFLNDNGVHVMPRTLPYNPDTLDDDLASFGYPEKPIAVKLKDGCGAVGFKVLDEYKSHNVDRLPSRELRANPYINKEQLLKLPTKERYVLSEYLSGQECGALCLVDHGRVVYCLVHENYDMQYATTTDAELVKNEEVENIVKKVCELLKLDGNIGFDFKRDAEGHVKLLECNPRISATVSLAVKAGVNIVEMGIFHKMGLPIDEHIEPMYGMRLQRVYGTLYTYRGKPYGKE